MKYRSLTVSVEVTPGTDIDIACYEMCELARILQCNVSTEFNGVHVTASPWGSAHRLSEKQHEAQNSNRKHKFATD